MSTLEPYRNWRLTKRIRYDDDGRVTEYSLTFVRRHADSWYDEIRYDSHERRRGNKVVAPHFHLKLRNGLKADMDEAVAELRGVIDKYVR